MRCLLTVYLTGSAMPESVEDMKDSWFFDENFNGLSDEFFDEVNFFDFKMEDLEPSREGGDVWNTAPQPTMDSFSASSSAHHGRRVSSTPKLPKYHFKDEGTCSQVLVSAKTSQDKMILLDEGSSDVKPSQLLLTSSPISVLESGNSCSAESGKSSDFELIVPFAGKLSAQMRRPRSKRSRPSTAIYPWRASRSAGSKFNQDPSFSKSMVQLNKRKEKKKNLSQLSNASRMYKAWVQDTGGGKKCTHCEVTKTPQWREGPLGPKSLCNACGVRYRSGRLFPEYRPAASPSFVASLHSNSHRKVSELRNKGTQMKNK